MTVARARLRLVLLCGTLCFTPGAAPPPPALSPTFPAGRYRIDSQATVATFEVKALVGKYAGSFRQPTGTVVIDPARPDRASIDVTFPVDRLTTGDASTDAMLKGDSFFNLARYPTVRFAADNAPLAQGQGDLNIDGALTMHGQTLPTTLTVRLASHTPDEVPALATLRFTGEMHVLRSRFGMGFGRPFVADRVELTIDATFRRS